MSPAPDTRRVHRSLAAVESRYVRDLGWRRGHGRSRAAPAAARPRTEARRDVAVPDESGRPVRGAR